MFAKVTARFSCRKALFSCWSLVRGLRFKQPVAFQMWVKGYEQGFGLICVNTWNLKKVRKRELEKVESSCFALSFLYFCLCSHPVFRIILLLDFGYLDFSSLFLGLLENHYPKP